MATVVFLVAVGVTAWSYWHTHVTRVEPSENFLYGQALLDVMLVTAIVHITGGQSSDFAPLYILVISEGALLLPLTGGVLVGDPRVDPLFRRHRLVPRGQPGRAGRPPDRPVHRGGPHHGAGGRPAAAGGDRGGRPGVGAPPAPPRHRATSSPTSARASSPWTGPGAWPTSTPRGRLSWGSSPAVAGRAGGGGGGRRRARGWGMVLRRSIEDGIPIMRFKTTTRAQRTGRSPWA